MAYMAFPSAKENNNIKYIKIGVQYCIIMHTTLFIYFSIHNYCQAIHGFREIQMENWSLQSRTIIERLKQTAFTKANPPMSHVHVLDIAKSGYIKPHIDSARVWVNKKFHFTVRGYEVYMKNGIEYIKKIPKT